MPVGDIPIDALGDRRRSRCHPTHTRPHRWHTGRIPTCLTGGAMVVERGGRGEGAWAELDGRQSNDVTITVGPGMVLPNVALQLP